MSYSVSPPSSILSTSTLQPSSSSSCSCSVRGLHSICRLPKSPLSQSVIFTLKINNQRRCIRLMSKDVNAEKVEVPNSVPVRMAHELLLAGHRYLDVRTPEEFSDGHPVGAVNIPYMFMTAAGMMKNPNFLKEVSLAFDKDTEIIVGCQSGKRSIMAASHLQSSGFTAITDIAGGYSSWVKNGLPTH